MKRTLKFVALISVTFLLAGCPSRPIQDWRDIRHLDVGLYVDGVSKILSSNEDVDQLGAEVIQLMSDNQFKYIRTTESWGILPATGHTQTLAFKLENSEWILCHIVISKKSFNAKFRELESEPGSDIYLSTDSDKEVVLSALRALEQLARSTFKSNVVRSSKYDQPQIEHKLKF